MNGPYGGQSTPITMQPLTVYSDLKTSSIGWGSAFGQQSNFSNSTNEIRTLQALRTMNECYITSSTESCCSRGTTRTITDNGGNVLYRLKDKFADVGCCGNAYGEIETLVTNAEENVICSFDMKATPGGNNGCDCEEQRELGRTTVSLFTASGDKQEMTWLVAQRAAANCCNSSLKFEFDPKLGDLNATVPTLGSSCDSADTPILQVFQGQDKELCLINKRSRCDHKNYLLQFKAPCDDVTIKLAILATYSAMMHYAQQHDEAAAAAGAAA